MNDVKLSLRIIGEGVSQGWIPDTDILIYKLEGALSPEGMRAYFDSALYNMQNWQAGRRYMVIYDLREARLGLSFMRQALPITKHIPVYIRGDVIIILHPSLWVNVFTMMIASYLVRRLPERLQPHFFETYESACQYALSVIKEYA